MYVCVYIYSIIGGWGGESFVKPQPGNRFVSFVRASGRARDQRFDCVARAVVRAVYLLLLGETVPGGLSTQNVDFTQVL